MAGLQAPWGSGAMATQQHDDLEAVLRSLKLAQAQIRTLKKDCAKDTDNDTAKEGVVADAEVALALIVKKLKALLS